jgi:hypothetical protein
MLAVIIRCLCRACGYEECVERNPNNVYVRTECPHCKAPDSFYKKFAEFAKIEETIIELESMEL